MTTASQHPSRSPGLGVLLGAVAVGSALGVCGALAGALLGGAPAAYGVVIGTLLVLGVLSFGSFAVELVSRLVPGMSMLVALLSYTLQLAVMLVALVALDSSGLLEARVDRGWLAGAVITGTFGWLVALLVFTTRLRLPAYDLADPGAR